MTDTTARSRPPPPPAARPGWGPVGKVRNPAAVIVFSIITLGIYFLVWTYKVFKEMKDYTGDGVGGVIGLVIGIVIGIVNWFLLPSEIGNIYEKSGLEKPVSWRHRVLEPDPAHRVHHLGGEGPGRDEPSVRVAGRRVQPNPDANWYVDPTGRAEHRYWTARRGASGSRPRVARRLDPEPLAPDLPPAARPSTDAGPAFPAPAPGSGASSPSHPRDLERFRSLRGLTTALTWVVGRRAAGAAAVVGTVVNRLVKLDAFEPAPFSLAATPIPARRRRGRRAAGWMFVVAVAVAVLCMIYLFHASQNTERGRRPGRRGRPAGRSGRGSSARELRAAVARGPRDLVRSTVRGAPGRVFAWWFPFVAGGGADRSTPARALRRRPAED